MIKFSEKNTKLVLKFKNFIEKNSIDQKYAQIAIDTAVEDDEIELLDRFIHENKEIFLLLSDLVASVSIKEIDTIGLLDKGKGFFVGYGDESLYFTLKDLCKMIDNHKVFKKAQSIYTDFLKGNGFNCLIMTK